MDLALAGEFLGSSPGLGDVDFLFDDLTSWAADYQGWLDQQALNALAGEFLASSPTLPWGVPAFSAEGSFNFPQRWTDNLTGEELTYEQMYDRDPALASEAVRAWLDSPAGGALGEAIDATVAALGEDVAVDPTTGLAYDLITGQPKPKAWYTSIFDSKNPANQALSSPIGQMLAALVLGGAGLGLSQAVANPPGRLTLPGPTQNPLISAGQQTALRTLATQDPVSAIRQMALSGAITPAQATQALQSLGVTDPAGMLQAWAQGGGLTGQEALGSAVGSAVSGQAAIADALRQEAEWARTGAAELYPGQSALRSFALNEIPRYIGPEAADPVDAAMRERVMSAIRGEVADPALEADITKRREILLGRLNQMYPRVSTGGSTGGAGAEVEGTVAGALAQEFDRNAAISRGEVNRRILETLAPQEQARRQFAASRGDTRLGQNLALTGFGLPQTGQTVANLNQVLPIRPLLGIDDATTRAQGDRTAADVALANYGTDLATANARSTAINRLFGNVASNLTAPRGFTLPTSLLTAA